MMYLTPCECAEHGWCERHQCRKSRMMFDLCRRSQQHFAAFESGNIPGLLQKAQNFTKAIVGHVADLGQKVSNEVFESRLSICQSCDLCDRDRMLCLHKGCGCNLNVKARWRSQSCPLELWGTSAAIENNQTGGE